jgi:hypothetical protein
MRAQKENRIISIACVTILLTCSVIVAPLITEPSQFEAHAAIKKAIYILPGFVGSKLYAIPQKPKRPSF